MTRKIDQYTRRYNKARAISYEWWPILEACYHYCIPNRNLFYSENHTQGKQKNIDVFDTTQIAATNNLVSKLHQSLVPPQQEWAHYETPKDLKDAAKESAEEMLQADMEKMFSYIHDSNFDVVINESFYDYVCGTGCVVINEGEDDNPLRCSSIPLDQLALEESVNQRCQTAFRTWPETRVADIPLLWPKAKLTRSMNDALHHDPNATVTGLVEAIIYNHSNKKKPYIYALWHAQDLLLDEEQESSPFIIFRWSKVGNETMGRGPIINSMPSIKSLQRIGYLDLTSSEMNISRPYMAYSDGVFNASTFSLKPNTIIPVSPNNNGQFPLSPLPDVSSPEIAQLKAQDLRNQINQLMFANPLGPVEAPPKTATELALRQRNLAEEIGPLFTRMQQEFLDRVIERVRYILVNKGFLDKEIKVGGKNVKIKYRSPLTLSQGQQDVQAFSGFMQTLQGLVGPEMAVTYIDTTRLASWLGEKLGVDATLINSQEEMQTAFQEKDEEMKEQQMMMQMQGMEQGGAAIEQQA